MTGSPRRRPPDATSHRRGVDRPQARRSPRQAVFEDVPEKVLHAARQAYDRRERQVVVAKIVGEDSTRTVRRFTFAGPYRQIRVEVRRLHGLMGMSVEVHPSADVTVRVRHESAELSGRCDALGRCSFAPVHPGPVSLLLDDDPLGADLAVATAWAVM